MVLLVLVVMGPNLRSTGVDDLDSAHHLMDGYFFRDLLHDHPVRQLSAYALAYYKQYPALGFIFWPPLVPAVYGMFCLVGGAHVLAVRACMLCFGLLFCLSFYALLRRAAPVLLSLAGVVVAATVPGMVWSFNEIMLEMPTLALMCVATLAYLHLADNLDHSGGYKRALLCALACGALIYSKQPAWFLLPALCVDYLFRVRPRGRHPEVWLAAGLTVLLDIPLAVFTVVFGRANLGQSIGSSTNRIMQGYQALPRGSVAAWTYYPRLAVSRLDVVVVVAAVAAFVLAFVRRDFLRRNTVWFAWFGLAYLTFSYYDNRTPRHATFWWPAWVALAVAAIAALQQYMPPQTRWLLPTLLLLPVPFHLHSAWRTNFTEYAGVQQPVAQLFAAGDPGNVLVFGLDKQVFTALIREHDDARSVHILRGERLLSPTRDVAGVCHDFRIHTVLVEAGPEQPPVTIAGPQAALLPELFQGHFERRGQPLTLLAYRYTGPLADKAADISLSSALTQ